VPPISVELKKQVKASNDIVDVIGGYIPVLPAGKTFKAVCPFHNDSRPSLQIDRQFQNYRCWACDARGDVFDFVMKFEKVEFPEALRSLAERAGIRLEAEADDPLARTRAALLHAVKWAEQRYCTSLMNDPVADAARTYIGTRKLEEPTVRQFGLGYAPVKGDWLAALALRERIPIEILVQVGLLGARDEGRGHYDRFRDRVMFPIRDTRGQTVGFGGRILPESPLAARGPKYYNSAETPLFSKSDLLYGLDLARHPGSAAGYLAVVEGYTDVMMAHQCGVTNVVATMGTALNARHLTQLRRYVPKVVLVFDADEGGQTGVDRALELFVSHDADLAIATLPAGLDPCDLLVQPGGVDVFRNALSSAVDALEFKLNQLLARETVRTVDGTRRVVDAILGVMAMAPPMPNQAGQVRQELIVSRLAHRLGLRQETIWARLGELRSERKKKEPAATSAAPSVAVPTAGPAVRAERQLLELLLAEPALVADAAELLSPERLTHSGLRRMLEELYLLQAQGQMPDIDALRVRMLDRPDLVGAAQDLQSRGRHCTERALQLNKVLAWYNEQDELAERKELKQRLTAGNVSEEQSLELLRRLQQRSTATASPN